MRTLLLCLCIFAGTAAGQVADREARVVGAPVFVLSDEAKQRGIDGTISANLSVDKEGNVRAVQIVAGPAWPCGNKSVGVDEVRKAVREYLLTTKFSPAIKNGKPADADMSISFAIGETYKRSVDRSAAEDAAARGEAVPGMVKGGVLTGFAIRLPKPEYPASARGSRASGGVPVQVLIDESGKVVLAGAIGGHPLLQSAARDAACSALFAPTKLSGKPVKISGVITYAFVP